MPQLDVSHYPVQIIWFLGSFFILLLCLTYVILPRVERSIRAREGKIQSSVDNVERIRASVKSLSTQYEEAMEEGRRKTRLMIEEEAVRINDYWDKKNKELLEEVQRLLQNEEAALKKEEADLLKVIKEIGKEFGGELESKLRA